MKKSLFILGAPLPLILPLTLISCSQNNDESRITAAREIIKEIVAKKPLPTLSVTPTGDQISLSDYLGQVSKFVAPKHSTDDFLIDLHKIELPILGEKDLDIWFKVTSISTLDIAPEIADFYSIKFSDIAQIKGKTIVSVDSANLTTTLNRLILENTFNISRFATDAILGVGIFSTEEAINIDELTTDPKPLNDRLTSSKINENIFDGYQKNIHMLFNSHFNDQIIFDFILGTSSEGTPEEIVTIELPIKIFEARKI